MEYKNIADVDENYSNFFSSAGLKTYDVNEPVFSLYGLCRREGELDFKRMPGEVAKNIKNRSVNNLYTNTSGIRVRFKTDSSRIVLKCVLPSVSSSSNMSLCGTSCFDLYADGNYCTVFHPGVDENGHDGNGDQMGKNGYTSGYYFRDKEKKLRDIVINFPLYNDVERVFIALEEDAQLLPGGTYRHEKPVVFYGSSITQGGCASHAGNSYANILSRRLDTDIINLGFSGGCRAEPELGEYIAGLPMSVFVYDYDHNAPTLEHLQKTHYPFYQQIRNRNPELPIIMISAADLCWPNYVERRAVIRQSYEKAVAGGDKNVYFIDGQEIYREVGLEYCVVDTTHPNDLGFWCMANTIGELVGRLLEQSR